MSSKPHNFSVLKLQRILAPSLLASAALCTGWAKKRGHRLMTIILSNFNRFKKNFSGRFFGKFAVKWILRIPPHLAYVATLPCETLMSQKQAINNKLQCSVATYLRCGGVLITKLRKVYCRVCEWNEWKKIKIGEYLAKLQPRT